VKVADPLMRTHRAPIGCRSRLTLWPAASVSVIPAVIRMAPKDQQTEDQLDAKTLDSLICRSEWIVGYS